MTNIEVQSPVLYARFSARLRAFYIDVIVVLVAMAAALMLATMLQGASQIVGFSFVIVLLLFEPILVSAFGSSIGHYLNNLRVVDNRTGGKIGFFKAVARTAIKMLLGVYSFISMLTTARHQALHDWLTGSTVQIRNSELARLSDYVHERAELRDAAMPPWYRRILVILAYLALITVVVAVAQFSLASRLCLANPKTCATQETILLAVSNIAAIIAALFAIGFGWRGKLFGARRRQSI